MPEIDGYDDAAAAAAGGGMAWLNDYNSPGAASRRRHRFLRIAITLAVSACVLFVAAGVVARVFGRGGARDGMPAAAAADVHSDAAAAGTPTSEWIVELPDGVDPIRVAADHGYVYRGTLAGLRGFHRFEQLPHAQRESVRSLRETVQEGGDGANAEVLWAEQQVARKRFARAAPPPSRWPAPLDALWTRQWNLVASSVDEAWHNGPTPLTNAALDGPRGRGIIISVVDDGLFFTHPDLSQRYVAAASRDVNGRAADPLPRNGDTHGTEAAGVAAATANNDCGVGVAPLASLAGVRVIGAPASDADEAEALGVGLTLLGSTGRGVAIYSCSWGPSDDGRRLEGPQKLTQLALERGTREGRGGRGALYVFACGNGAQYADRADYDGYASSRYTIAVGAVGRHGRAPWYSEPGAAVLVAAPSSDGIDSISTARAPAGCTSSFGGTSAAAPLVAGALALALEVRPELTWRDAQALLARTSTRNDVAHPDWQLNGAGLWTSHQYGYGVLNASRLVDAARTWTLLGPALFTETPLLSEYVVATPAAPATARASVAATRTLEHVELDVDISCERRGALTLTLTAPSGTVSTFMRPHADVGRNVAWRFTSVRHLGESARGLWTLALAVASDGAAAPPSATLRTWRLRLHGA